MIWKPNVTVATVIEQDGKYLLVEEEPEAGAGLFLNQPAGHLDPGESIIQGAIRETLKKRRLLSCLNICWVFINGIRSGWILRICVLLFMVV
jgi:ADP-ribose pyrophosphatase YjhB (NUDIX family)